MTITVDLFWMGVLCGSLFWPAVLIAVAVASVLRKAQGTNR